MLRNMRLMGKIPAVPANIKHVPRINIESARNISSRSSSSSISDGSSVGGGGGNSCSSSGTTGSSPEIDMTIDEDPRALANGDINTIDDMTCSDDTTTRTTDTVRSTHNTHPTHPTHPGQTRKPVGTGSTLLEYEFGFYKAIATFKHQMIFNVKTRTVRT